MKMETLAHRRHLLEDFQWMYISWSHSYKLSFWRARTLQERAQIHCQYWEPNIFKNNTYSVRHTTYIEERPSRIQKVYIYPSWLMRGIKQNQLSQLGRANRFSQGRSHMCTQGYRPALFHNFILFQNLPNILSKPWMIRWRNKECIFRFKT